MTAEGQLTFNKLPIIMSAQVSLSQMQRGCANTPPGSVWPDPEVWIVSPSLTSVWWCEMLGVDSAPRAMTSTWWFYTILLNPHKSARQQHYEAHRGWAISKITHLVRSRAEV